VTIFFKSILRLRHLKYNNLNNFKNNFGKSGGTIFDKNLKFKCRSSSNLNPYRFTRFSPSYDLLLQPENGLMNIKPKHVATTLVTKQLPLQ